MKIISPKEVSFKTLAPGDVFESRGSLSIFANRYYMKLLAFDTRGLVQNGYNCVVLKTGELCTCTGSENVTRLHAELVIK